MNDRDDRLEALLSGLQPRRPSDALRERIAKELARADNNTAPSRLISMLYRHPQPWLRAAAGLVVLLAGMMAYIAISSHDSDTIMQADVAPMTAMEGPAAAPSALSQYRPVAVKRYLVGHDDAGIVGGSAGPAHKVIYRTMERSEWHDPVKGRHCTIWKPHEQAVVVDMNVI